MSAQRSIGGLARTGRGRRVAGCHPPADLRAYRASGMKAMWMSMLALVACANIPDGVQAVRPFDTQRYMGTWYEIMRSDNRFERGLDNVTATYTVRVDGAVEVRNQGYDAAKERWDDIVGKAKPVGDPTEGRLKVSFFGPFYSGYNVIALDKEYRHALVVGGDLGYVWLLSRSPGMPATVRKDYLDRVHAMGVDTTALIRVKHDRAAPR